MLIMAVCVMMFAQFHSYTSIRCDHYSKVNVVCVRCHFFSVIFSTSVRHTQGGWKRRLAN